MRRNPGAPRLIEWTGERCVPWAPLAQLMCEHMHRYELASWLVRDRDVLDLGSGEGFGAAMLADTASSVHGIDIDAATVRHAELNYGGDAVTFSVDDATRLAGLGDDRFDAVVAFEVLEHVADQDSLLAAVRRVLRPGGLVLVSTPNRAVYATDSGEANPYHVRELDEQEFRELLGRHFANARLFSQLAHTGSRIETLDHAGTQGHATVRVRRDGEEWVRAEPPAPWYMIAVASDAELPELPAESTLVDHDREMVMQEIRRSRAEIEELSRAADARVAELAHEIERLRAQERDAVQVAADRERELDAIRESASWRAVDHLRSRYRSRVARSSLPGRGVSAALRAVERAVRR